MTAALSGWVDLAVWRDSLPCEPNITRVVEQIWQRRGRLAPRREPSPFTPKTYQDLREQGQIIGHFGLGFYSAFMVADSVEIRTLSYRPDAKGGRTLLVNTTSPIVRNLLAFREQGRHSEAAQLVVQIYDLAMLSCQDSDRERMERFLERSNQLLARIAPH